MSFDHNALDSHNKAMVEVVSCVYKVKLRNPMLIVVYQLCSKETRLVVGHFLTLPLGARVAAHIGWDRRGICRFNYLNWIVGQRRKSGTASLAGSRSHARVAGRLKGKE